MGQVSRLSSRLRVNGFSRWSALGMLAALGGCSSLPAHYGPSQPLLLGSNDPDTGSNGMAYAVPSSMIEDLEEAGPIKVKIVRSLTDWDSGTTRLVVSDEILILAQNDIASLLENPTITVDSEVLVFTSYLASDANGREWESYLNTLGEVSGTGAVFFYSDGPKPQETGEFDSEAFFALGVETDPDEITALGGVAYFIGDMNGYGQVLDPRTNFVILSEQHFNGTISLTVDFGGPDIEGHLDGEFKVDGTTFTSDFNAPIQGNGYYAPLDTVNCADATCTSRSAIGGVFYGSDALETSGILGLDVTVVPYDGTSYRFVSGGGFTAVR